MPAMPPSSSSGSHLTHAELDTPTRLREDGAEAYPVTSGSKGMQLYTAWPVSGATAKDPSTYAKQLATEAAAAYPKLVVTTMTRSERPGRLYVDWSQNNPSKTTITPYSMRGREHPTVAAPRTWDEIEAGGIEQLRFDEVLTRVGKQAKGRDPLAALADRPTGRTSRARSRGAAS